MQLPAALDDFKSGLLQFALAQIHVIHRVRANLETGIRPFFQIFAAAVFILEWEPVQVVLERAAGIHKA